MSHVFICYSHKDITYVEKLTEQIKGKGFEVWRDDQIGSGAKWQNMIEEYLDTCTVFVIVMSSDSKDTEWVHNEMLRAIRLRKTIIPLLLDGDGPWLALEAIQYMDVRDKQLPKEAFFEELAKYFPLKEHSNFVYFSTQSQLKYAICEKYFYGEHYVFCTKEFDSPAPQSGSPSRIYSNLLRIVEKNDSKDPYYYAHIQMLRVLAERKFNANVISRDSFQQIEMILARTKPLDLRPVMYLIERKLVRSRIKLVEGSIGTVFSTEEFVIEDLKTHEFQILRPPIIFE